MRTTASLLAAACAAGVLVLPALAANPAPPASSQAPTATQPGQGNLQNRQQKLQHSLFAGSVVSTGDGTVVVNVIWAKSGSFTAGQQVTVGVGPVTKITKNPDREPATLGDVKPGDLVGVGVVQAQDGPLTARRIHISCNCHWVGGTVTGNDGTTLTVEVAKTGPFDTVLAGHSVKIGLVAATNYLQGRDKHPITAADVKVGDKVGVIFAASGFFRQPGFDWTAATFTAKRVQDWKRRSPAQPQASEVPTGQSVVAPAAA